MKEGKVRASSPRGPNQALNVIKGPVIRQGCSDWSRGSGFILVYGRKELSVSDEVSADLQITECWLTKRGMVYGHEFSPFEYRSLAGAYFMTFSTLLNVS